MIIRKRELEEASRFAVRPPLPLSWNRWEAEPLARRGGPGLAWVAPRMPAGTQRPRALRLGTGHPTTVHSRPPWKPQGSQHVLGGCFYCFRGCSGRARRPCCCTTAAPLGGVWGPSILKEQLGRGGKEGPPVSLESRDLILWAARGLQGSSQPAACLPLR